MGNDSDGGGDKGGGGSGGGNDSPGGNDCPEPKDEHFNYNEIGGGSGVGTIHNYQYTYDWASHIKIPNN